MRRVARFEHRQAKPSFIHTEQKCTAIYARVLRRREKMSMFHARDFAGSRAKPVPQRRTLLAIVFSCGNIEPLQMNHLPNPTAREPSSSAGVSPMPRFLCVSCLVALGLLVGLIVSPSSSQPPANKTREDSPARKPFGIAQRRVW